MGMVWTKTLDDGAICIGRSGVCCNLLFFGRMVKLSTGKILPTDMPNSFPYTRGLSRESEQTWCKKKKKRKKKRTIELSFFSRKKYNNEKRRAKRRFRKSYGHTNTQNESAWGIMHSLSRRD